MHVTKVKFDESVSKLVTKIEFRKVVKTLATKAELKKAVSKLATKAELKGELEKHTIRFKNYVDVRIQQLEEKMEEKMYTKADHEKYMVLFDEAMKELRDAREARVLSERQILRMDDKIFDHGKRISVLESRPA